MRNVLSSVLLILGISGLMCGQQALPVMGSPVALSAGGGTPTLLQYRGKIGIAKNVGGSTTAMNAFRFNLDPTGYPLAVPAGALVVTSVEWPNNPTTTNGYHVTCTAPCAPTFSDDKTNTWAAVFAAGSQCLDSAGFDHGFYYAVNAAAGTSVITETHPQLMSDTVADVSAWYNIATTSPTDGSSCKTNVTPANNTAPNITGNSLTTTANGDLILVGIDDQGLQGNTVSSITVPSNCTLLDSVTSPAASGGGIAHHVMYCYQTTAGSFTPTFTVAQATHDAFTIYAVAFKAGSGGTAPSSTAHSILLAQQAFTGGPATYTQNVACPTATSTLVISDDVASVGSVTDSNSDTFSSVTNGGGTAKIWYKTGISIANPNTFTVSLHITVSNGNDLPTFYCTTATALDAYTAGSGNTQVTADSVFNSDTQSSGGALGTYTNLPTGTPASANDLIIVSGSSGTGPFLSSTQPSGAVVDYVTPSTLANCLSCDTSTYMNGDLAGHYWSSATTQQNFGWTVQNNAAGNSAIALALN